MMNVMTGRKLKSLQVSEIHGELKYSYVCVCVCAEQNAVDYNAPFQGLIAYQLSLDNVDDPPYVSITEPRPHVSRSHPMEKWLIAVIVIVVIFVVALGLYICWWKRQALRACCGSRRNQGKAIEA